MRNPLSRRLVHDDNSVFFTAEIDPIPGDQVLLTTASGATGADSPDYTETAIIVPELLDGIIDTLVAIRNDIRNRQAQKRIEEAQEREYLEWCEDDGGVKAMMAAPGTVPDHLRRDR